METNRKETAHQIVHELLRIRTPLTETKARALAKALLAEDEETFTFLLLKIARNAGGTPVSPSTPSGMIPPYQKENSKKKRKKKAGAKFGHKGSLRAGNPQCRFDA